MWAGFAAMGFGWVGTGIFGIIGGVVAILLGIIGLVLRARGRGRAIVALVFGTIAIAGWTAFYFFILAYAPSMLGKV